MDKVFITHEDLDIINAQLNAGNDVTIKRFKNGYKIVSEVVRTVKKYTVDPSRAEKAD